jgi:hypothetical protein
MDEVAEVDFDRFRKGEKVIYSTDDYEVDGTPRRLLGVGEVLDIDRDDVAYPWLITVDPKHNSILGRESWMRDYNVFPNVLVIEEDEELTP